MLPFQKVHGFKGPVFCLILRTFAAVLPKVLNFIVNFEMKWI